MSSNGVSLTFFYQLFYTLQVFRSMRTSSKNVYSGKRNKSFKKRNKQVFGQGKNTKNMSKKAFLNQESFSLYIIFALIFVTMSLLDQLDAQHNENSLDIMLGLSPMGSESSHVLNHHLDEPQAKQIYVTYNWIWNDEDPISSQEVSQPQDKAIDQMKSARIQQEQKFKLFMSKLSPLQLGPRKISMEDRTQTGSPKKKRIRKMTSTK